MKLIYRILIRLSFILTIILAGWGFLFYISMINEINDEVDDSLEDYTEEIIIRALAGQELPSQSDGTNNFYYLSGVSEDYASQFPHIQYQDKMIYIEKKGETEPARILQTIFKDRSGQYFQLTVSTPTIEKEDLQGAILQWVIFLYFALLIIVLTVNIWVFHGSMSPLYTLLKWLDQYTISKTDHPLSLKTNITEFKRLNEAIVRSAERNQAIFEQQKQFIGNASHELQTPLAICQNRLELLTDEELLSEEQLQEITKVQQTLSYIIRLNKSLLFLSKIDNGQYQENKDIHLNTLIRRQLEDYQEIYAYKQITIEIKEEVRLQATMNETLATALITNLMKNAYTHNIPQGKITITIHTGGIRFCNTGIPETLDSQQIFHRFYQGHRTGEGSAGLGLSIAEAICKLYHMQLRYSYSGEHCFELFFQNPG